MIDGAARPARWLAGLCLVGVFQAPIPAANHASPAAAEPPRPSSPAPPQGDSAILVIDLPSGRALSAAQPDVLAARIAPGSVLKIATLVAALEAGVITPDTRFTCRRHVKVGDRQVDCVHPDLGRPMSPAEALAHSCNDFFVTIGERLPRDALSATTAALGLGPIARGVAVPLAAVGLDGIRATPEQLLRAFVRATDASSGARMRRETREVLLEGLRGAARYGTARAIGDRGIDALAKTGTAPMPGGGYHGLALALSPAARPSRGVVVLVPGGSGADAAAVAADTLAQLIEGTYGSPSSGRPNVRTSDRPGGPDSPPRPSEPAKPSAPAAQAGVSIRVGRARAGGYDVVQVPLEDYVARVVAGEAALRSAPAALEALAIAVRTFAIANLGRHRGDGFDLCDLTHCQVMRTATAATRAAAAATAGQVLTYRGQPASIFYTASCGGQSEIPSEVWPRAQDQPFLTRHKDSGCGRLPEWRSEIAESELVRALRSAGFRGDTIRDLQVGRRSGSGRASVLQISGLTPDEITGDDLRIAVGRTLGWQLLRSTAFEVERTSSGYRFVGRGSGHGVGLCVVGSARMAGEGKSAAQILAEYFPGTKIEGLSVFSKGAGRSPVPSPPAAKPPRSAENVRIDVVLPVEVQTEAADVQKLVRRTLGEIAERARVPLPADLRLVFHPTVESYSRQTRQPWWTAAATSGNRIDLLPLSVLRERGIVERTLRHEIAHVVSAPVLGGRPVWVKEGAAIYLSGERVEPPAGVRPGSIVACPKDDELLRSQSAALLRDAYARAATCYAARITAGARWDEVR